MQLIYAVGCGLHCDRENYPEICGKDFTFKLYLVSVHYPGDPVAFQQ